MAAKARLEAQITGNDTSFIAAVDRAEKRAETFSGRIEHLFRKDPGRRQEGIVSRFLGDLSIGNVQGAITGVIDKVAGLPLAVGVGVGAGIIVFEKFRDQIKETQRATIELNKELEKPLSAQAGLGSEGISAQAEAVSKSLEALRAKRQSLGSRIQEAGIRGQPDVYDTYTGKVVVPDREPEAAKATRRANQRLAKLSDAQVVAMQRVNAIRRTGLRDSTREAEIAQIRATAEEQVAGLRLKYGREPREASNLAKRIFSVRGDQRLSEEDVNKKYDAKQREQEAENAILNLRTSSLTKDQQALVALRERIALLKQVAAQPGPVETKTALGTQIHGLETQETALAYNESRKTPAQRRAERSEQRRFQNFSRTYDTPTNPNAYITHPDAYKRSPDAYNGPNDVFESNGHKRPSQLHRKGGGGDDESNGSGALTKSELEQVLSAYL